ncbi:hypothetical protein LX32DRAFT_648887 [Colletotrichum zoysiae]|uniref:Uncharacterized protein n=1 Tax=Colletotrichum zoysiae TaxID=1216348 RepID=A0AAD9HRU0_9PEZI|nr:hypothetical protein LX32DRAFT_648887 [Colletotrichum zoysiae]
MALDMRHYLRSGFLGTTTDGLHQLRPLQNGWFSLKLGNGWQRECPARACVAKKTQRYWRLCDDALDYPPVTIPGAEPAQHNRASEQSGAGKPAMELDEDARSRASWWFAQPEHSGLATRPCVAEPRTAYQIRIRMGRHMVRTVHEASDLCNTGAPVHATRGARLGHAKTAAPRALAPDPDYRPAPTARRPASQRAMVTLVLTHGTGSAHDTVGLPYQGT